MATVNEEIRDQLLAHQVELLRFSKGMSQRVVRLLDRAEPEHVVTDLGDQSLLLGGAQHHAAHADDLGDDVGDLRAHLIRI